VVHGHEVLFTAMQCAGFKNARHSLFLVMFWEYLCESLKSLIMRSVCFAYG
jgi:hypothetical protein